MTADRGLALYPNRPPLEMARLAHLAEDLGYRNLWFGDSQGIWREVYVTMAAAAVDTSRIVLGTGVTNGVTRHRAVLASAWATLHELTGGRVAAGLGVGDSALRTAGLSPMKVAELEHLLGDLRGLWRAEEVVEPGGGAACRLGYLAGPLPIPVYVAASGPRLLELAGRLADGVILLVGTDPQAVRRALATVAEGAARAGRRLADIDVVLWAPVAVADDPEEARDRVRAHVARTVLRPVGAELSDDEQHAVDRIRATYDYEAHMVPGSAHARLVPATLVDRFALAGDAAGCRSRLDALSDAGVDQVAMVPFAGDDRPEDLLATFAAL